MALPGLREKRLGRPAEALPDDDWQAGTELDRYAVVLDPPAHQIQLIAPGLLAGREQRRARTVVGDQDSAGRAVAEQRCENGA